MTIEVVLTKLSKRDSAGVIPVNAEPLSAWPLKQNTVPNTVDEVTVKPANRIFRWNLLFLAAVIVILAFPVWFSIIPVANVYIRELILSILICFHLVWLFATICAASTVNKLRKHVKVNDTKLLAVKCKFTYNISISCYR